MTRFIRLPEVLARVGVSWLTIYRWEQQGLFPARRHLSRKTVAWVEDEVEEWCQQRSRAADEAAHV
jgi:prophage regulatory protein